MLRREKSLDFKGDASKAGSRASVSSLHQDGAESNGVQHLDVGSVREERITQEVLRDRLADFLGGRRPHPHTIAKAIHRGLPCEPHPLIPGRRVFPWGRVLQWIEEQRRQSSLSAPLRASLR